MEPIQQDNWLQTLVRSQNRLGFVFALEKNWHTFPKYQSEICSLAGGDMYEKEERANRP